MSLALALTVCVLVIARFSQSFFPTVFIEGLPDWGMLMLWMIAAIGWGDIVSSRLTRDVHPLLRVATSLAIGLGLASLLVLLSGLSGILSPTLLVAWIIVGVALASFQSRRAIKHLSPWLSTRDSSFLLLLIPAALLAIGLLGTSLYPQLLWKPFDPHPYDVISYHLQIAREWYDLKRIVPLSHNSFSYFPMGMEMHYLAAMHLRGGAFQGMYLAQSMSLLHAIACALAVAGCALQLKKNPWIATLAFVSVPWVVMLSCVAYVETGVMLFSTLSLAWLLISIGKPSWKSLIVAGVCIGFACGYKYTAIPMTAIPLGIAYAILTIRQPKWIARIAVLSACAFAVTSPWFIRNAIWTHGNPVFPLATNLFGHGPFTPEQIERYTIAHQVPADRSDLLHRLQTTHDVILYDQQFGWIIIPLGIVCLMFIARQKQGQLIAIAVAIAFLFWIGFTHLQPRFATPLIPWIAIAIALAPSRYEKPIAVVVIAASVIGGVTLFKLFTPFAEPGQQGFYRLPDPSPMQDDAINRAISAGEKFALIGDAQAFNLPGDSRNILYRGVFDVTAQPNQFLEDAWLGQSVKELNRDHWIIINYPELWRLHDTYRNLPVPSKPPEAGIVTIRPDTSSK